MAPQKTVDDGAVNQDIAIEASLKERGLFDAACDDEGDGEERVGVPVIDMSKGTREEIVAQLWDAATKVGFFSLVGHGIPQELIDRAFSNSSEFFSLPLEEKRKQCPLDMSINCGFEHYAQVRPSTGVADQKESVQITAREGCMNGRWPILEEKDMFQTTANELLVEANQLAGNLLDMLQPMACPQIDAVKEPHKLSGSHTLWSPECQCTLRFLHYPSQAPDTTKTLLKNGYWRAGPHTDWCNLTLLFQRPGPGQSGLECCANPRTSDNEPKTLKWTKVDPIEGAIAVNIGDMLARWSDGRLYSNLHRVRLPEDASEARYSIAFFAQSDKSVLMETKSSKSITAGEYILGRIRSNFATKK
jgi:isopenicillin N synthase-like dioxygenase